MPLSYSLARRLMLRQRELRRTVEGAILGPDAKSLVSVSRDKGRPVCIDAVVLSSQHDPYAPLETVRELLMEEVVKRVIPRELCRNHTRICLNPGGPFTEGGPVADAGLTGRKIVADAYGPRGGHGGGAFSGKDGTKVDRSGAYAARRLAREYVASGVALVLKVTAIYAIGAADQLFADIELTPRPGSDGGRMRQAFFGGATDMFKPSRLLADLGLTRPIFRQVAAFGHFGRTDLHLPWEEPLGLLGEEGRSARPMSRKAGNRTAAKAARVRPPKKEMK
jgi:S-adenosylmethionine synthetase